MRRWRVVRSWLRGAAVAAGVVLLGTSLLMFARHGAGARLMYMKWQPMGEKNVRRSLVLNAPVRGASPPGLYDGDPIKGNSAALGARWVVTSGLGGIKARYWVPWAWVGAAGACLLASGLRGCRTPSLRHRDESAGDGNQREEHKAE